MLASYAFLLEQMITEIFFCMLCLGTLMQIVRVLLLLSVELLFSNAMCHVPFKGTFQSR